MGATQQALLMAGRASNGSTTITWNSGDKNANITLSNADLTATGTSTNQLVRSATGKSTGKLYFEITVVTAVTFGTTGIAKSTTSLSTLVGGDATPGSYGIGPVHTYTNGASTSTDTTLVNGSVVGIAVDLDAGKIWFSHNGAWINGGDPANGTNPRYSTVSGTYYPASSPGNASHIINANLSYPPPSGFSVWT